MTKLVVVIDTQYDFMMEDGKLPVPGAEKLIVPGIQYLAKLNPDETVAVVYTYDTHEPEVYVGSPESEQFPIHCVGGEVGWSNVFNPDLVNPKIPAYSLQKGVFNMWEEPGLFLVDQDKQDRYDRDQFFADCKVHGVDTVEIWGVASDFCVLWAVQGFVKHGFKVNIVEHLTAGIERDMKTVVETEFKPGQVNLI